MITESITLYNISFQWTRTESFQREAFHMVLLTVMENIFVKWSQSDAMAVLRFNSFRTVWKWSGKVYVAKI